MSIEGLGAIGASQMTNIAATANNTENQKDVFSGFLDAAMNMVGETNNYQNLAESAETQFALGLMDNTHDLQVAQEKANVSLQYTVAVRDKVIDAYKEIMNMQI